MRQARILRARSGRSSAALVEAVEALQRGSVIIMPTDTVYGIAADARYPGALETLYEAKSRDRGKPVPILAGCVADVEAFGAVLNRVERTLVETFWPGPLTLVLKVGKGTEGFRVPAHAVALALLKASGGVLRVTSANVSGEPPALTAGEAVKAVGAFAAVTLDAGRAPGGTPSTVARVVAGKIRILRDGAIGKELLEQACRRVR